MSIAIAKSGGVIDARGREMNNDALRESIVAEAERLAVDALYSEKAHFVAAAPWRRAHRWLGAFAAVFAFAAGAGFVVDSFGNQIASMCAFISGLLSSAVAFLNPDEAAKSHHSSGVQYGSVRRKLRQFVSVSCANQDLGSQELSGILSDVTSEINQIQAGSKAIPCTAYRKAKEEINAAEGTATYTDRDIGIALESISKGPVAGDAA